MDSLFDHLEAGVSLDDFLDDFPSGTRDQAVALILPREELPVYRNTIHKTATGCGGAS
ncbi:hypothetical protein [Dyadobacter sp. BHUBP1]|uniref:hypothetical protein n=1 Tax=Dyadobacter sp. BHUBP1 TaxID=3424178 RepID=UPI003D344896